jgi:HEAT repeat protein
MRPNNASNACNSPRKGHLAAADWADDACAGAPVENRDQPEAKSPQSFELTRAIERLKSLRDGERGFTDVVSLGVEAIPALCNILFQREPSGLHVVRCRAADALATLKAYDVLAEFLQLEREISDPIERLGEDAVINSAARGLARAGDELAFRLLSRLASHRLLNGVVAALGSFKRAETIPLLVKALAEDDARLTAEAAIRSIGAAARPALIEAATTPDDRDRESESSLRKRRSAIALLTDLRASRKEWPALRPLMLDQDVQVAILACRLGLAAGESVERSYAVSRLAGLRAGAHWLERLQIDQYLSEFGRRRA